MAKLGNFVLVTFLALSLSYSGVSQSVEKPNIILIMADDLGYGDLGCYGSKLNSTPNIDRLAEQGMRFTDFQAAAWCAPSRVALMTGCHPNRPGLYGWAPSKLAGRITIAEMLKERGYSTALIGKWHIGMGEGLHPLGQGFDYWYGTRGSNDTDGPGYDYDDFRNAPEEAWKTPLMINRETVGICPQSEFTQRYTKETIRLIQEQKDKPFFIYLAHNMPHVPIFASDDFKGKSDNGVYGDVLLEIDWSVGEILKTLKETGISKKTLVIFTSDNGPWTMFTEFAGVSNPLQGEKGTTWEGGGRVPCIFYWPETIKAATRSDFIVNTDLYATFAALTATTIKKGEAIDSQDMSGVLLSGAKSARTKHIYYFHLYEPKNQAPRPLAYRSGDYKIHFLTRERLREPETGAIEPSVPQDPPLLFNIRENVSESINIAAHNPDIVKRLTEELNIVKSAIDNWEAYR